MQNQSKHLDEKLTKKYAENDKIVDKKCHEINSN